MSSASKRPLEVVVARLSSFGDIVLSEPVTRALKCHYPDSHLAFAVGRQYAGLPALFGGVDRVLAYSKESRGFDPELAEHPCDVLVDLQANRHSRNVARLLGARRLLTYRRPRLGRFFTVYLPWIWKGPQPHTVKSYFRTLEPLGISYSGQVPVIVPPAEKLAQARGHLGVGAAVGICPGSSSENKSWGDGRFRGLVNLLARDYRILLAGSVEDGPAVERILQGVSANSVSVYTGNDVGMLAGLLALCRVTVTNDSGLMHLAGAVGSKPVAIFGPTSPLLGFAPAAEGGVVLTLGLECSPCSFHGNKPCRLDRRYCMEGITPERVASEVARLMQAPRDRQSAE